MALPTMGVASLSEIIDATAFNEWRLTSLHSKTGFFEKLYDSVGSFNVVLSAGDVEFLRMKQVAALR